MSVLKRAFFDEGLKFRLKIYTFAKKAQKMLCFLLTVRKLRYLNNICNDEPKLLFLARKCTKGTDIFYVNCKE